MSLNVDDPLGIVQVSGFYGPGAWAAWSCAITSSWYIITRRSHEKAYTNLLLHVLYTNWAAIDVLRQETSHQLSSEPFAAAVVVTFWGLLHITAQRVYCFEAKTAIDPRILQLGTTIPSTALFSVPAFALGALDRTELGSRVGAINNRASTVVKAPVIGVLVCGIRLTLLIALYMLTSVPRYSLPSLRELGGFTLKCTIWTLDYFSYASLSHGLVSFLILRPRDARVSSCSVFKPCTAQSMAEWDQTFALACALILLAPEHGKDVRGTFYKASEALQRTCRSIRLRWTRGRLVSHDRNPYSAWVEGYGPDQPFQDQSFQDQPLLMENTSQILSSPVLEERAHDAHSFV
jgi:hypothetical protein